MMAHSKRSQHEDDIASVPTGLETVFKTVICFNYAFLEFESALFSFFKENFGFFGSQTLNPF